MVDKPLNLKSTLSNKIQEQQAPCSCGRGEQVRYYCAQDTCPAHRDDIFFCDDCFSDLMMKREPHFFLQIPHLLEDLKGKWMPLIEKEGHLYAQVSGWYNSQKEVIEWLERQAERQAGVSGRFIRKDMLSFDQFHEEFRHQISQYEEHIQTFNAPRLMALNQKRIQLNEVIDRDYQYLTELGKPEYVFDNYKSCIQNCPIPTDPEQASLRESVLSMKVKLGKSNIEKASSMVRRQYTSEELIEEMNNLKHIV
ncbi:hypothetical protein FGO68_gene1586 [Halteria grandinella]|uniref:Uncharacterized protein n=1 Tax=Halteria grandinella TaxID=5974 RepID=A0A8J8NW53_HALGN|nr:hypothetical protein FGO68_gene1586 [Halteria grandinella]